MLFLTCPDHCSPGGDAEEGARAGRGQEEAGSDQTATVQVSAQRTARGQQLNTHPHTQADCCCSVKGTPLFLWVKPASVCVCVCVCAIFRQIQQSAKVCSPRLCHLVTFSYSYNHSSVDSTTFCKEKAQFVVIWLQSWFLFFIFIVYLLECDAPQANQAATVCPEATVTFSFFYNCNSSAQPFKPQTWLYWHLSWYSLWTAAPNTFAHYSDECRPFSSSLAPWFLCESHRVLFVWVVFNTNMKAGFIVAHWCFL